MLLIVGLGNPGPKFEKNRHNVGFMAVDRIIDRHNFTQSQKKFKSDVFEGKLAGEKTLILKPDTFMNLSGEAVGQAMRFYKLAPEDIFVIHDELDLAAGKVRIKQGGSPGGHNGLKSMDAHCGKEYFRFRLGIGHPGNKARVNSHVLGDFAKSDAEWLEPLLDALATNADLIAKRDNSTLMNKISLATKPAQKKTSPPTKEQNTKAKSHIHQARQNNKKPEAIGPMADMLKKLLGKKED